MKSPHRVILASAGTGKTFELSSRYLALIADKREPSSILATTFTRKAAGEILDRIFKRLAEATEDAKKLKELQGSVDASLTAERCTELTASLARRIDRLQVSTIDAFFGQVLRAFALDLGVPPGWKIIDEETDASLKVLAIQKALMAPDLDRVQAGTLLRMLRNGSASVGVYDSILSSVGRAYSVFLQAGGRNEWGAFKPAGPPPDDAEVEKLVADVGAIKPPPTKEHTPRVRWVRNLRKAQDALKVRDWRGVLKLKPIQNVANRHYSFDSVVMLANTREVLVRVCAAANRALLHQLNDRNAATRELMVRFDAAYQELKTGRGWMRFDDVPRLLTSATEHLDDLYFRLDGRIDHLLLDEFQDTSLEQFHILRPIMDELLSQGDEHDSRSVLCVGDVKQSLYSWRGAVPELLSGLRTEWEQLESRELFKNYRSSPVILSAVNQVFEGIARNAAVAEKGAAAAKRFGDGFKRHTADQETLPGEVRLTVAPEAPGHGDGADSPGLDKDTARAKFVAERVKSIRAQSPVASIAVLTRTNKLITRIILELREKEIPAVGERGNPLTDSPAASAAISALQLAEHPGDSAARFHLATSPLGPLLGLSREDASGAEVASRLRARVAKAGVAGLLRWMQIRLAASMDEFSFARFDQLLSLAEEFDAEGGPIGDFVNIARSREVEPPRGFESLNPVRVLTIHKAKGLEFDAVLLPELDRAWNLQPDSILIDRRDEKGEPHPLGSVTAVTASENEELRSVCPALDDLYRRTLDRSIGEELCGLYVAMTRARRYLEMILSPRSNGKKADPTAARVLSEALVPGVALAPTQFRVIHKSELPWYDGLKVEKPAAPPAEAQVRFASAKEVSSGRLRRRSPSSLEGGDRIDLGELWGKGRAETGPGAAARDRGTAFHAMFEAVGWLDDGMPTEAALLQSLHDIESPDLKMWIDQFLVALRGKSGEALKLARYSSRPGDPQIRREWRFAVREDPTGKDPLVLEGQFDRVVFGLENGRAVWAEVVDFKTDDVAPGDTDELKKRAEFYRPQIEAYKRAAAKLLHLPERAVTAALVFCGPGEIVKV